MVAPNLLRLPFGREQQEAGNVAGSCWAEASRFILLSRAGFSALFVSPNIGSPRIPSDIFSCQTLPQRKHASTLSTNAPSSWVAFLSALLRTSRPRSWTSSGRSSTRTRPRTSPPRPRLLRMLRLLLQLTPPRQRPKLLLRPLLLLLHLLQLLLPMPHRLPKLPRTRPLTLLQFLPSPPLLRPPRLSSKPALPPLPLPPRPKQAIDLDIMVHASRQCMAL